MKIALKLNSPSFFQHLIWLPLRIFMLACCSTRIKGIDNVKNVTGPVLFASNHVSEIDPLLIVASLPFFSDKLPIIYVVREKKAYNGIWNDWRKKVYGGEFFRLIGGYEAYKGLDNYDQSLRHHLEAIDNGQSVCVFPVGRFHTKEEINQARGGAAYLAKKTMLPVIPIHIQGIDRHTSAKDYLHRKPKLSITFGEPVYAKDIFPQEIEKIIDTDRKIYHQASIKLMEEVISL